MKISRMFLFYISVLRDHITKETKSICFSFLYYLIYLLKFFAKKPSI